ncbi:tRNA (adenosine(37)-N6)-threonylcarbamoyltransferase complex dimerization subunit type 1 TsaB [Hoyosella rhizosphaerae]|uniref:tRNA (Adenosine(37)-N6)-threonylcarbamoyltransferase complex dimerization subunit type 1 TsaB n=1 Tax=Hoyosella rhizosphaerae TaxID=1755582 RepID=A0A916UAX6_9ACTN|nr:tRNA (adenosine(37)-N6)-threonylcarbamoyltransferase complex dimerization subunit type 1 TsaB [Hoyosella rhizosphaerae]MBN4926161.1 tRNA (adenosine(37)-N6)-threonylcarbamoyltransferase complex dimerization subunit type 1 TsaB [Hoyosella rhizosphaerae]GGC65047.1 tRNA (adenosine(37)-N6)-threonylcarbamoyltransferase complex dimerization subunit type 1 TsaB [Hoyosella rhizosphaerae]
MLILAVDTSTPAVTAGLVWLDSDVDEVREVARRVTVDARAHAEVLTPQIVECFAEAGRDVSELSTVVVGQGPGPYTGLRVGMVTGAAFADAVGVPVYGVCSLDAIAAEVAFTEVLDGPLLVVTDARRREVYWAHYDQGRRIAGPGVVKPAELVVEPASWIAGSAQHVEMFDVRSIDVETPTPRGLVAVAASAIRAGEVPEPLVPMYLRRPDATEPSAMKNPPGSWKYGV